MITLGEIVLIHDLQRQGLSVSAIARRLGVDRKTVRRHLALGMAPPVYGPRPPRPTLLDPYHDYLCARVEAWPDLTATRLLREIRAEGYTGCYSQLTQFLRTIRPPRPPRFERRFETPPGRQAQVDFAQFRTVFDDEPGQTRILWLFTLVLGHSRWLWGRFCASQDLQTVLRCHLDAFAAMDGAPAELLYDRMKTAVLGEDADGVVQYNAALVGLLNHYGAVPRACRPYRAKTKGKVERPYRYVREDFWLARRFRNLDDLNAQFAHWRSTVANARVHATTRRVVAEHFAAERPALIAHPAIPYSAVLTVERRVSREGMVSVGGNLYSVPDTARRRVLDVQNHPSAVRIFEDGVLIATHPVLEGKNQRRVDPAHRKAPPPAPQPATPAAPHGVGRRPLAFYDEVGRRLAGQGAAR